MQGLAFLFRPFQNRRYRTKFSIWGTWGERTECDPVLAKYKTTREFIKLEQLYQQIILFLNLLTEVYAMNVLIKIGSYLWKTQLTKFKIKK